MPIYFKKNKAEEEDHDTECDTCIIDLFDGRLQADLKHTSLHDLPDHAVSRVTDLLNILITGNYSNSSD